MTDYTCPNCRGGFPDPETLGECPWCGQAINGDYEPPTVHTMSKVKESTDRDTENHWLKDILQ
jgi:hypothetical protein